MVKLLSAWQLGHLDKLISAIGTFYDDNSELLAILLGAFLASIFGICTERLQKSAEEKRNIKRSSTLLLLDLEPCLQKLRTLYAIRSFPLGEMSLNSVLVYAEDWRNYYEDIASEWDARYHEKLVSIYATFGTYNQAIRQHDAVAAAYTIDRMIRSDDAMSQSFAPVVVTAEDVINALKLLSFGKKVVALDLKHFFGELYYIFEYNCIGPIIEQRLVVMLSETEKMEWGLVASMLIEWASHQPRLKKMEKRKIERIAWDTFFESPKIQMVWNECSLRREA